MLHELGVLHYLNGEYDEAVSYFVQVAENCQEYDETVREPSIFNLGHAYRKKREFDHAATWYRAALAINPRVASTYSALGFTLHLKGDLDAAIELYHQVRERSLPNLPPEPSMSSPQPFSNLLTPTRFHELCATSRSR